jgi:hypothetical protein
MQQLPATIVRLFSEVIRSFVQKLPDMIQSTITAAWKWYWKLSMVPMFLVTAVVGVVLIELLPNLPISVPEQASVRGAIEGGMVLFMLLALFLGVIRGGGKR